MCCVQKEKEIGRVQATCTLFTSPLNSSWKHLAKQLAGTAGVLSRTARLSSVQSCDLVLISTEPCSTNLMTSKISQQKWDSLKGAHAFKRRLTKIVSLHMQSKAGHNYQDVNAGTEMLSIRPRGHLNQKPFRNEQAGVKEAALAREWVFLIYPSWTNTRNQCVRGIPESLLNGQREDPFWVCVTQYVCLHQRGGHK